jgi:hypothetical protein
MITTNRQILPVGDFSPTGSIYIPNWVERGLVVNPDLAVSRVSLWDPEEDVCEL